MTADFNKRFKGKNILIQGLGLNGGGLGTSLFFVKRGFPVTITDLKTPEELKASTDMLTEYSHLITYRLGEHSMEDFATADIVVKGPGVPPSNKFIQAAREKGAEITSDIALFLEFSPCPAYAVTGSKGKSSTVTCIYEIFKASSPNSFLGGNITISPLTFIDEVDKNSLVILELSSWQLRDLADCTYSFAGTAVTNILDDHQNYYSSIEDYIQDKMIIMRDQDSTSFTIIPEKDKYLKPDHIKTEARVFNYSPEHRTGSTIYYKDDQGIIKIGDTEEKLFTTAHIGIPGTHIRQNILLAAAFSYLAGIDKDSIQEGITNFKGAPFRMEKVGEWKGITFINDTTATIPDAAYHALKSFDAPLIWIAGGNDKNLDFTILEDAAAIPKEIFLLTGNGTEKMKTHLNRTGITESSSLEYLFEKAVSSAKAGDVILFSPGCTSFGLFTNEFHRGRVFNELVVTLIEAIP